MRHQLHKSILLPLHDGREVVVKVTRPDIRNQILQDFEILAWAR